MKKIISLLLVLMMVVSLCSCSLFGKNSVISVGIVNDIVSLDPTRATGDAEKLIVSNCFEGLVRFDENGAINLAAATSYSVDKTGCVYTFNLNPKAEYHVSDLIEATLEATGLVDFDNKITAEDFEYGIKRFIASGRDELDCIKGAKSFSDVSSEAEIGVEATDEHTLKLTLDKADPDFLYKLATLPLYPCDKAFYDALGDIYASTPGTTLTNGPYYIKDITQSEAIIERCDDYTGLIETQNKQVIMYTTGKKRLLKERFLAGTYDMYLTSSTEVLEGDYKMHTSVNSVWGLVFNCKSKAGADKHLRDIIMKTADFSKLEKPEFAISKADRIVPDNFIVGEKCYVDFEPPVLTPESDAGAAQAKLKRHLKNKKKKSFALTFAVPSEMKDYADSLVENWNIYLSPQVTFKVVPYSLEKVDSFIKKGNYDMAIMPVTSKKQTALSMLTSFSGAPCYYTDKKMTDSLYAVKKFGSDVATTYQKAEQSIASSDVFFPLFYTGKVIYYGENVKGIYTADNGRLIYFHSATSDNNGSTQKTEDL